MQRTVRLRGRAACALAAVLAMSGAAHAWGCVPMPLLVTLKPAWSGPAGTEVTVEGLGFDPGPLEVRWAASDGPTLASVQGESFSARVTIPDVEPGLYAIIVLSRGTDGSVGNTGTASFQVIGNGDADVAIGDGGQWSGTKSKAPADEKDDDSTDAGLVALAASGGGALVLLGGLVGAFLTRRRRSNDLG